MDKIVESYKRYYDRVHTLQGMNKQQVRLTQLRELGLTPDNKQQTSKYMFTMLKYPDKYFIDFTNPDNEVLQYDSTTTSIYTFKVIDPKTKEDTGKRVDIQRGNLKNLRSLYGFNKVIEELITESMCYMCNTCGQRLEHEEYEDDPNMTCPNCGDSDWVSEHENENTIRSFKQFVNEAYVNNEKTKQVREDLKKQFPQFKFSVRKEHHSAVNVHIISGPIKMTDDPRGYEQVNQYYIDEHYEDKPEVRDVLKGVFDIIDLGNFDKSDIMSDYHHVGFYVNLSIGRWDKPYVIKK